MIVTISFFDLPEGSSYGAHIMIIVIITVHEPVTNYILAQTLHDPLETTSLKPSAMEAPP